MKTYIQRLVLHGFLLCHGIAIASIFSGTFIKTTHGLAQVENICCGDELIAYSYDGNVTTCIVREIAKKTTDSIIAIITNNNVIQAAPDQLFYDPIARKMKFLLDQLILIL